MWVGDEFKVWAVVLMPVSLVLIACGDVASLIFFGGFLLLAVSGTVLQDRRKDRMIGVDWQRFASVTSNVPFAAITGGRNQFRFDEIGWGKVLAGLALYFVLAFLHPFLFGVRPY